ncbi:hypothetical protein D0839_16345 [Bordetella avium]|nr:hypothetical protein D0844_16395 [Bordetella avium]RIQ59166.1 hypothetical protein D0840_16310 [Bordetella avium]RIQ65862.1 hypothetical protein D0839_16345 [Bordetella avium]SUV68491.1 Uncharacterised protein [Bordetella avium]
MGKKGILGAVGSVIGIGGSAAKVEAAPKAEPKADPEAERRKAENEAATAANAKTAELTRQRRAGSLLASGSAGGEAKTSSVLAYGKGRLGD